MNCREISDAIDDHLDEWLPPEQAASVEAHVGSCPACRQRLARERALRAQLRHLPAPMPEDAWFEQAIARAVDQDHHRRRKRWIGIGGALAASLVLAIALSLEGPDGIGSPDAAPDFSIALHEEREFNLVVESPRSIDSATFTVRLPEGIELAGYPGHHKVTWEGRLKSGKNLLVLPLRAETGSGGDVVTHVSSVGKTKTFTLRMQVEPVTTM